MNEFSKVKIQARACREASRLMASAASSVKESFLTDLGNRIYSKKGEILAANAIDLENAKASGLDIWKLDRMTLTSSSLDSLAQTCRHIAKEPDPVGATETQWQRPNGILVGRMRIPLGVIAMIYEARPAVTIEAAILALKAGNAIMLRGGSDCENSNKIFANILKEALTSADLPENAAQLITGPRSVVEELCEMNEYIDLMIPRGGESLIRLVAKMATMPVLLHYKGVCHAYIDKGANLEEAVKIVENSKMQRPGVCNALECLLVQAEEAGRFLPMLAQSLAKYPIEYRADKAALPLLGPKATPACENDYGREFLGPVLAVRIVADMDAALAHIAEYGSHHTEIICTTNYTHAMRFVREVDASMVGVNVSTRFNDGGQLGLGAEIGISTTKIHAYGPMGLKELTTTKFVVLGNGQIRG